jgi:hypothetical protein
VVCPVAKVALGTRSGKNAELAVRAAELNTQMPRLRNAFGKSDEDLRIFQEHLQHARDTLDGFRQSTEQSTQSTRNAAHRFAP